MNLSAILRRAQQQLCKFWQQFHRRLDVTDKINAQELCCERITYIAAALLQHFQISDQM